MGIFNDLVNLRKELDQLALDDVKRDPGAPPDDLLDRLARAEKEARRLRSPDSVALILLRRAELLLGAERTREAICTLADTMQALGNLRQDDLRVRVLGLRAEAHAKLAEWQEVSAVCDEGIGLVEKYRYKLSADYLASAYLRSRIGLYSWGVRSAYELGKLHLMIERAELSKCRLILGKKGDEPASESVVWKNELRQLSRKINSYSRESVPKELINRRRALWDLIAVSQPKTRPTFDLEAVQAALDPEQAIIYYYWIDPELLGIVVLDHERYSVEVHSIGQAELELFNDFAAMILSPEQQINHGVFESLSTSMPSLIPRETEVKWQDKTALMISPHRKLHCVPFHALRHENRFLIERAAISYIANLTSLQISYKPRRKRKVLAIGVDEFRVPGRGLRRIPEAEREVREIGRIQREQGIPITVLTGEEATGEVFRGMAERGYLAEYSCLHFATHGENVSEETPMESYFYLNDSAVDGLEVADLNLEADVVVLSACSSGQRPVKGRGMEEMPGDEMFGLQAAFFRAGAHQVLGTLWPVDSTTAVEIMTRFHVQLAERAKPEDALRTALLEYLAMEKPKTVYWAPFFLSVLGRVAT
jgi:CHAT domain-containing protein